MKCGFWNVGGWNTLVDSDNSSIREKCLLSLDLDVIGIAETHLKNNDVLELTGYVWLGHNRKNTHIKAKKGSGGVGVFLKQSLFQSYDVNMIDNDKEGILWLKFSPKGNETEFLCCVCYLPPINSTRNIDGNEFFDTLLSQIHMYCKDTMFFYAAISMRAAQSWKITYLGWIS